MRLVIIISFFSCLFSSFLNAQESPVEVEMKRRYKAQSYFSCHLDYVYTFLNGTGGNERSEFYKDYIQDLNKNGIVAEGGLYGRNAFSFGIAFDQYLSRRFAIHYQVSYWQTGYREKLNVIGESETGQIIRKKLFKANLNYLHLIGGLKYYNDLGLTLTLGGFINYNIADKIRNVESFSTTGSFGDSDVSLDQNLYFHEYYGQNRIVFLTGGMFSIGYKWKNIEFDASLKATGPILDVIDDKVLNVYQLGVRYKIPTKREDI